MARFAVKVALVRTLFIISIALNVVWMYRTNLVSRHLTALSQYVKVVILRQRQTSEYCNNTNLLEGVRDIDFEAINASYARLMEQYEKRRLKLFGPTKCKAQITVAIIVPFRDRELHLQYLLGHLHPILQLQRIKFQIFVVEQAGDYTFNKGRLMNTGFEYARKIFRAHFDCFIFHDVDSLPIDDRNLYTCGVSNSTEVHHLLCSTNKRNYKPLCCGITVGGVLSFTKDQYLKVNGYPNDYWGWGGEDDDMDLRIKYKQLVVKRPSFDKCRYFAVPHRRDKLNRTNHTARLERVEDAVAMADKTGLNNLNTTVLSVQRHPLYVRLSVDVGLRPSKIVIQKTKQAS